MYYSIEINNFKSIKNASIELPSFGAVVGKNAAGKTNLIQAIQFVRDLAKGKTATDAQKAISLIPHELFNFNDGKNEFEIKIILNLKDEKKYLFCVKVSLINGSTKPASLFVVEEKLYEIKENGEKEVVYSRDKNILKDKSDGTIPVVVDINKLALALYKTQATDLVRDVFIKTVIPNIEQINNRESIALGSTESEYDNLANIIVNLHRNNQKNYDDFQKIIKALLPNFSSVVEIPSKTGEVASPSAEKENYLVVLEERNLKQQLSMQSVSSGDLKTLLLIATAMSMENDSILIIEEIENGIHPKRIIELIERLERISTIKTMQILFTTHSPIVINSLSPQKIVLTDRGAEMGTQFTLLSKVEQISEIKKYLQEGGGLTDYLYTSNY
ncbi:ATP-binding protein [Candidatus Peregrinibacteria bacterium]|nr:ATP-binding protein [Candidatus Peregrinibacteria bacterium]